MLTTHLPKGADAAIALHAEAFKSDPFAAARMTMNMRCRFETDAKAVKEDALRIITDRRRRVEQEARDWKKSSVRRQVFEHFGFNGKRKVAA